VKRTALIIAQILLSSGFALAQSSAPLTLNRTIDLHGVKGGFDHFAIDQSGMRLFAAAKDNHSVEVIDLKTDVVAQQIKGLAKPHGLAWDGTTGRLYVADGTLAEVRVYEGSPFTLAGTIKLSDDADDMVYDETKQLLFVGHGGGGAAAPARIAVIDAAHFKLLVNLAVKTHPEGLDIDAEGQRVFANIADSSEVAVIGAATHSIEAIWRIAKAKDNVPLAFDGAHQLLYVACRTPGMLLALNASTGDEVASLPAAGKADDLFYDPKLRRVYLISGAGEVDAFQVDEGKMLHPLGVLHTAVGAKTALLVPSQGLLYVGVPGTGEHDAEIRVYSTGKSGEER
jgi:DNA-binding beta-propeller fold protein YncE